MSAAFAFGSVNYAVEVCCNCGMHFCITSDLKRRRLDDRGLFYCPNGHGQHYTGQTEAERLRAELDREKQRTASALRDKEWAEKNARGARIAAGQHKAAKDRLLKRVAAGVCPRCHRTFRQLAAHMKCKHGAK